MEKKKKEEGGEQGEAQNPPEAQEKKQNMVLDFFSNKIQRNELKPGDHIYSWRYSYLYSHHGIYAGDGKVIHFTRSADHEVGAGTFLDRILFSSLPVNSSNSPCLRCGDRSKDSSVVSSCLECFLNGGELYKFEYGVSSAFFLSRVRGGTCTLAASDPADHVIYRAEYLLQNGFGGYDIFKNNCEDFAIYCKTGLLTFTSVGLGRSGQATSAVAAAAAQNPPEAQEKKQNMVLDFFSNKIQRNELKPGDHIYSWRHSYLYSHHGIYVGDEKVIHFTRSADHEVGTGTFLDRILFSSSPANSSISPCPRCGDQSRDSGVISSCLECFLNGGELYKFEYGVSSAFFLARVRGGTCTLAVSDPTDHVIYRAEYLLQNGFGGYDIFKNNCEDFAIYCKTGLLIFTSVSLGRSGQATSFVAAATALVSSPLRFMTTSSPGLAVIGCGIYCISRFVSDIGMRRDVIKVPVERLVTRPSLVECTAASELPNTGALGMCKND